MITIITLRAKKGFAVLFILFLMILFFTNAKNISSSVLSSLEFCAKSVIPSLFPYMVISSLIVYTACFDGLFSNLPNAFFNILGICKRYCVPIITGNLCGFVTGAKCICDIYEKNPSEISDFSDSVILSSNAGIGFVIGYVGIKLWSDMRFGIFIYSVQIISSFLLNRVFRTFQKKRVGNKEQAYFANKKQSSFFVSLARAVSCSCSTILQVCSFVIFYSLIIDLLSSLFYLKQGDFAFCVLCAILEFCKGTSASLSLTYAPVCAAMTGFCIGFGGICVHSQIFSVCDGFPLNKTKFFAFKALQGVICSGFCFAYAKVFSVVPVKSTALMESAGVNFVLFAFVIAIFFLVGRKNIKKYLF
ncbi:MAG: hypothetical protein ACI3XS_06100 [Eubacteriales bacterium]